MNGSARVRRWPLQAGIVALALATAIIHIVLAIPQTLMMFYLNGLGYIVLLAAYLLPQLSRYRDTIRWGFIAYTALTIVLWLVVGDKAASIAYIDKAIELALIALLWIDRRPGTS